MTSLNKILTLYQSHFDALCFPPEPGNLYEAIRYFLAAGGKRIRPVLCLLGNDLFGDIQEDTFHAGNAIELYHNYSLVHDDIMDRSPLRRGRTTLHIKYNTPTAILAGDVLLINAFSHINNIREEYREKIYSLFTATALQICEGQQMDLDFEETDVELIGYPDYLRMVTLKTSVLLAASIKIGAIIGGATAQEQAYIYDFGKNIGIAFQMQDDYLDAFGDPAKTGKQPGGDILENKKTALLIKALEMSNTAERKALRSAMLKEGDEKIASVLNIYKACKVEEWAINTTAKYTEMAFNCLSMIDIPTKRKDNLITLTDHLLVRQS